MVNRLIFSLFLSVTACSLQTNTNTETTPDASEHDSSSRPILANGVAVSSSSVAAYDPHSDQLYIAEGGTLSTVEYETGELHVFFHSSATIVALAVSERAVVVLSDEGVLIQLNHHGDSIYTTTILDSLFSDAVMSFINEDRVVVLVDPVPNPSLVVTVDLQDQTSVTTVRAEDSVYYYLYQSPGVHAENGRLFLPSAYPGEIVEAKINNEGKLAEVRRTEISDWIHDVVMLDESHALVSGHLEGVGVVDLDALDANNTAEYTHLSPMIWAYSLLGTGYAYSVANASLLCVETDTFSSWSISIPGFEAQSANLKNVTRPVGQRVPGRVLIHQPGTGLIEMDCAAEK